MAARVIIKDDGFNRTLKRLRIAAMRGSRDAVTSGALFAHRTMIDSISKPGGGRTYQRERSGSGTAIYDVSSGKTFVAFSPVQLSQTTHTASAPGKPPASDTGGLRRSIVLEIDQQGSQAVGKVAVKANQTPDGKANYRQVAKWLEFGTRKVKPRPFVRPARLQTAKFLTIETPKAIQKRIRKALQ